MLRQPNPNYNKVAFVTGITGQIGSYLAEYLLELGYGMVIGMTRRQSNPNTLYLKNCLSNNNFKLEQFDLTDLTSIHLVFDKYMIDLVLKYEIYNLAAQSHVAVSFKQPKFTADVVGLGHLNILEAAKFYHEQGYRLWTYFQASSEMMGSQKNVDGFQNLDTKLWPNSPYACAKLYAFHMNRVYRESYGMKNSSGIIFNTESPRRGEDFVTRKITKWFAAFANLWEAGERNLKKLQLGNIHSYRDWSHAKDSVKAVHLINTSPDSKDYVVASGETHTILEFMEECYNVMKERIDVEIPLSDLYEINPEFLRPNEVSYLKGDASLIKKELGWQPAIGFKELVKEMFLSDYSDYYD